MEVRILTHPDLAWAMVLLKKAAARANQRLGLLPGHVAGAIVSAADQTLGIDGLDRLVTDRWQAGCGLRQDRLVAAALVDRANDLLVSNRDEHLPVISFDQVNLSLSSEETVTAAARLAVLRGWLWLREGLSVLKTASDEGLTLPDGDTRAHR